ncbi:hypothetical protein Aperf_G00000060623 [Anoplocephala perfoliata]
MAKRIGDGNVEVMTYEDNMNSKDNTPNKDKEANFIPGILYTFLWIGLAVFVAWPFSTFLAPLYIFLLPLSGCIEPIGDIMDVLLKVISSQTRDAYPTGGTLSTCGAVLILAPRSASMGKFMNNMAYLFCTDNVDEISNKDSLSNMDNVDNMDSTDSADSTDSMDGMDKVDKKTDFFPGIIFTFLWINLAIFVAWPLSVVLAPLYIFLLPFAGCIEPIDDIVSALLELIKLPRTWVEKGVQMRPPTDCSL